MTNNLRRPSRAGSLESGDCLVTVMPGESGSGRKIKVQSIVINQFGEQIRAVVEKSLAEAGIEDVVIDLNDRGAVDFVIRARVKTAVERALKEATGS